MQHPVMRPANQTKVIDGIEPAILHGDDMVEMKPPSRITIAFRALTAIP